MEKIILFKCAQLYLQLECLLGGERDYKSDENIESLHGFFSESEIGVLIRVAVPLALISA